MPPSPRPIPPEQTAQTLRDVLGRATYDTLLAAHGANLVLVSDDFHLRNLAQEEFQLPGVWLQSLLFSARDRNWIDSHRYTRATASMVAWEHRFISVGAADLALAAERADWHVSDIFRTLAATLSLRTSELQSNIRVAVGFLKYLWGRRWATSPLEAAALTYALLEGEHPDGAGELCVLYYQHLAAYAQSGLLPWAAMNAVSGWYRLHFLPPIVGAVS